MTEHKRVRRVTQAEFEVRESPGGRLSVSGYAAVFNQVAYGEVVRSGAFTKTLAESPDVVMLINHDGLPLARTHSGTLRLRADGHGLLAEAPDLDPTNPTVQEVVSGLRRGDVDKMSFGFFVVLDRRNDDGVRELLEVSLDGGDVSIVTYPWYDGTSVGLQELDRALADVHAGRELTAARRQLILDRVNSASSAATGPPVGSWAAAAAELDAKRLAAEARTREMKERARERDREFSLKLRRLRFHRSAR